MLISRGTRRVIGLVTLVAFLGVSGVALTSPAFLWAFLKDTAWLWIAGIAILVASNGYRLLKRTRRPPPPKPRPTHLKLVKTDETLH